MAEHLRSTEKGPEISQEQHEQKIEQLRNKIERESTESDQSKLVEAARKQLEQQPEPGAKQGETEQAASAWHPAKLDKQVAYNDLMKSLRSKLNPVSRAYSRVIHNPTVEKVSDAAAVTVFRPSVTLGATVTAFVMGSATYLMARYYGFSLSGSEFILSLVLGGVIGLAVEYAVKLLKQRR